MKLTPEIKQQLRDLMATNYKESGLGHREWVEQFCDEVPDEINDLALTIDEDDQDAVTDHFHQVMAELK